jgi:hypothetical protein
MAVVRLSDAIIPAVYDSYGEVNSPELTAFLSSGIVARSPLFDAHMAGPSETGTMPFWNDVDATTEPNYSNDDNGDAGFADKIGSGSMAYRKAWLNMGWSAMDLVKELAGSDPMRRIRARTSTYWLRQLQRRIVAVCRGLLLRNIASNSSDMTIAIHLEAGNSATAANRLNGDAVISAAYTLGDNAGKFVAIAMHSTVKATLVKNNEIAFVRASDGSLVMETYKGLLVITDDGMPVRAGTTNGFVYTTVLFGAGAFALGTSPADVPFEVARDPDKGNGGGQETLWERKQWLLHPLGHSWVEAGGGALVEKSPTLADLANVAKWTRVLQRKLVPIAFVTTNG